MSKLEKKETEEVKRYRKQYLWLQVNKTEQGQICCWMKASIQLRKQEKSLVPYETDNLEDTRLCRGLGTC